MKRFRKRNNLHHNGVERFAWLFFSIMSVMFVFPMFLAVMVSITSEESIRTYGYRLIPDEFSLEAYKLLFTRYGSPLIRAVVLTVGVGVLQPVITIALTMSMAYPLSQPDFKGRNFWRKVLVITMLFSGGTVPTYILYTTYLGLKNSIFIYLLPGIGAWNVFLFRTFFVNIDKSMIESAKIDGANNYQILWKIMLPLTKPLVAMQFFSAFIGRWNDINTPLYYVTKRELYTVQYLLQEMLKSAQTARELLEAGMNVDIYEEALNVPIESTRFALAVIGALPVFILFPYIQKYYAKGIMVGSTKG